MKIFIEIPSWIGDCVMFTPALKNLQNHFYKSEIFLFGNKNCLELFKHDNSIKKLAPLESKKYSYLLKIAKNIGQFDLSISFRSSFRSKIFLFFIRSNKKYQYNKLLYKGGHQVVYYNEFVNTIVGGKYKPKNLSLKTYNIKNPSFTRPTLGINPGAAYGNAKKWSPEKFAEVAYALSNDYHILIFGAITDFEVCDMIENYLSHRGVKQVNNLCGKTTIEELVNAISGLSFFITGDSGPMHIAAAFEIPTISIFGPTNDLETCQWQNHKSVVVKKNYSCMPCKKRTCPLGHNNCMAELNSKEVIQAYDLLMSEK